MAPLCLLYFAAVAICLGAAGHLVDRSLPRAAPRRWIWCLALACAVVLPPVLSMQHSSHVIDLWGRELVRLPAVEVSGATASGGVSSNWLECSAAYGRTVLPIWLGATILLVLWGIANAIRVGRLVRSARDGRGADHRQTLVDGVNVVVTENLGPATTGLLRARVLLPRWVLALPVAQRRYVVRHEEEHRRSHDAALLCMASLVVALMPWNVPLWWLLRRLQLAVEMDCDRRVVSAMGDPDSYGELLLTVAEVANRVPRLQPALLGGVGMLEQRITALVAPAARGVAHRLVAPLLAILLLAVVLSVPHPQPAAHAQVHRHEGATVLSVPR
jgi:beta-lactamase regulating signal transducer with metallopeptidase domain